jgi:hypothetical protein
LLLEVLVAEVFPRRHAHIATGVEVPALGFDRVECGRLAKAGVVAISRESAGL